ncbi:hypothetical protein OOK31_05325 [Streptomyces sp. NBC_00249]|uniref:hypothetical protein n=1 Tax=Streptomyces sp. NBC_00249 TaxID=2975690 RepID=UPI0022594B3B|nr:hypothetical protein [Streptomyces sp. NBC_00249]MCX5193315.1 hypothetical protein [Streptomyces sp. NBC_00249]
MGDWYRQEIVDPGKQPLLFLLLGFLGAFLFIRLSVRMIRAEVSWWPRNVTPGGLHIHHVVFGVIFMIIGGLGLASPIGTRHPWAEIEAALFGIGTALVLDEFALILHLKDVYWSEDGRLSVDAVVVGAAVCGLLLLGAAPFGVNDASVDGAPVSGWTYAAVVAVNAGFALVALGKGKAFTGLLGILVPLFTVVGALRLARPGSPWARSHYPAGGRKAERAQVREEREGWRRRLRIRVYDAIAGKPSAP